MTKQTRFQNQTLNSEDYEKIEKGASNLKKGVTVIATVLLSIGAVGKYFPDLLQKNNDVDKDSHGSTTNQIQPESQIEED